MERRTVLGMLAAAPVGLLVGTAGAATEESRYAVIRFNLVAFDGDVRQIAQGIKQEIAGFYQKGYQLDLSSDTTFETLDHEGKPWLGRRNIVRLNTECLLREGPLFERFIQNAINLHGVRERGLTWLDAHRQLKQFSVFVPVLRQG